MNLIKLCHSFQASNRIILVLHKKVSVEELRHTTKVQLEVEHQAQGNHLCIVHHHLRPPSRYTVPMCTEAPPKSHIGKQTIFGSHLRKRKEINSNANAVLRACAAPPIPFTKSHTCSGVSANVLPDIVKLTSGIDDKLLQSTMDSPFGLGRRSQSCSKQ